MLTNAPSRLTSMSSVSATMGTSAATATSTSTATATATPTQGVGYGGSVVMVCLSRRSAPRLLNQSGAVVVTVLDADSNPAEGLPVYAFDGTSYTGYQGTTDEYGQVSLELPDGSYRFRADKDGTQFWSGEANHCTVPGCESASITVTIPVVVNVEDTNSQAVEGLPVYVFDGATYTGFHGTTDEVGQASFTLPQGDYRFRADKNGAQFWSGETNHCSIPGCESASITVTVPVTIAVQDTDGVPKDGLPVYAFTAGSLLAPA